LPEASEATLTIFNANGQVVFTQTADYQSGEHQILLSTDNQLTAGLYYYRLATSTENITKSMLVLE